MRPQNGNIGDRVRPVRTVEPTIVIVPPQRIPHSTPAPTPERVATPERELVPA